MQTTFRQSLDAILFASGGWFLFCVCDAMSKYMAASLSAYEILACTGVLGLVLCTAWIGGLHGLSGFLTPKWPWYILRSLSQAGSSFLVIKSLALIPLADFYGIIFMTPMVVTLLAALFLKEKIGIYRISAIAVGFIGVLIIAGPSFDSGNKGYLYALIAVACASLSGIFVRKIGREKITIRYAFFPFLICTLIFVPMALIGGFEIPADPVNIVLLLLFAPLLLVGLLGYSIGFSRARDTALVAPFHYTQMIWGALLGFVIFGDIPAFTTFAGSILIVLAGLLVIWREHVLHRQIALAAIKAPL